MIQGEVEFQSFINKVIEIKKDSYEEFIRIKYLVDGVLLAKATKENCINKASGD